MYIAEWQWDDRNIEHMAGHSVLPRDVEDVWLDAPKFRKNRKDRAATHQMIGPDRGGRCLAVFIVETTVEGLWRVVTARTATTAEKDWWKGD